MNDEISDFLASLPYADKTKHMYTDVLSQILAECQDLQNITVEELLEILNRQNWRRPQKRLALSAMQKFIAWRYGHRHPSLVGGVLASTLARLQPAPGPEEIKNDEIENFLASFRYSDSTKRTYRDILARLLPRLEDPSILTAAYLLDLLRKMGWGQARQCLALVVMQRFLRWKFGPQHPALSAKLKRPPSKPQRALDRETALKLLASFDPYTSKGARDLAICSLALDTGLRESELCRLQLKDVDLEHRVLEVIVKGGSCEAAIFSQHTAGYIERYLNYRGVDLGGCLFLSERSDQGLTPEGLFSTVQRWGWKIGIKLAPHDLRRSMAVLATLNGASERSLMALGRWQNSDMVKRYTRTLKLEQVRKYLPLDSLFDE
jgi:integrase/recombinase XerD